jgi:hypothetical protein
MTENIYWQLDQMKFHFQKYGFQKSTF